MHTYPTTSKRELYSANTVLTEIVFGEGPGVKLYTGHKAGSTSTVPELYAGDSRPRLYASNLYRIVCGANKRCHRFVFGALERKGGREGIVFAIPSTRTIAPNSLGVDDNYRGDLILQYTYWWLPSPAEPEAYKWPSEEQVAVRISDSWIAIPVI